MRIGNRLDYMLGSNCPMCNGALVIKRKNQMYICPRCDGRGYI